MEEAKIKEEEERVLELERKKLQEEERILKIEIKKKVIQEKLDEERRKLREFEAKLENERIELLSQQNSLIESTKVKEQKQEIKIVYPFEQKLEVLQSMGFVDREKNIKFLIQHKGELLPVIEAIFY